MSVPSDKPEYPPLLPIGRHVKTLDELQAICVDDFPNSRTRVGIMRNLRKIVARLAEHRVECELWVDGSFLTRKTNADDCDLILRVHGDFYDNGTLEQRGVIDWVLGDLKHELQCHSAGFFQYDESSPNYWVGEYDYCFWMKQWGFSRQDKVKGIAVLKMGSEIPIVVNSTSTESVKQEAKEHDPAA